MPPPGLLTITGAVGKPNRGPLDPVADQMMHRHGVRFDKACVLDAAALQSLPAVSIEPTLEYDGRRHRLDGPLLTGVLDLAGVAHDDAVELDLRAVDGYTVTVTLADVKAYRMIVALRLDGKPMALGGLGPQWAVYDADVLAAFRDKPVNQRFAKSPWGLQHRRQGLIARRLHLPATNRSYPLHRHRRGCAHTGDSACVTPSLPRPTPRKSMALP